MKKRVWATFFVLIVLIALVPASVAAYDPIGDGVLPPPESYDIFINVDDEFGMSGEDFNALLRAKLLELQGKPNGSGGTYNAVTDTDIKTYANETTVIDTTNLDGWYVYDNYNYDTGTRPGYWGVAGNLLDDDGVTTLSKEDAWMKNYNMQSTTDYLRPAFFITDSNATNSNYNTIEEIVSDPAKLSANWKTSQRLKEHIYSYIDDAGKPGMWFFGYGNWSIADFLFYPTTSEGTKNVKFTVDSSYVYTHALSSAGFLFNTGIDSSGYIHGYVALYKFSSATAVSRLSIYKIKDNVLASDFHNGTLSPGTQPGAIRYPEDIKNADRVASLFCTEIAYVTSANLSWASVMSIDATITTTTLTIDQGQTAATRAPLNFTMTAASGQPNGTVLNYVPLTTVTHHGFGPIVQYSGSGHNCYEGSAFKFCDLEMSFYDPVNSVENTVLDVLNDADFIKNSEKYFINLLSVNNSPNLSTSDWEAIARMRENNIFYVTNVNNPYLNDGGYQTSGAPLGNNGLSTLSLDPTSPTYYEDLATMIAKYILTGKAWNSNSLPALETPTPVGMFYLMARNPNPLNNVEVQVYDIVRNFVTNPAGVQIYTDDRSTGGYKNGKPIAVTAREYLITYPDGHTETVKITGSALNAKKDNVLVIYGTSDLGTYTVTLTVTNADGNTSAPVTLKFTVGSDSEPPEITWVTPSDNTVLFETPDTDVNVHLTDSEYGVAAYSIGYKYPGDAAPIYQPVVYVATYPNYKPLHNLSIDIPLGVYELWIQVWDGAGRLTVESLSVDNRYDITLADVTVSGEVIDDVYYPETDVKYNGKTLRIGTDYTLAYVHDSAQLWNAVITGIGDYKHIKTHQFINPTTSGLFLLYVHGVGDDAPTGLHGKAYASILSEEDRKLLKSGYSVEIDIYVDRVDEEAVRINNFDDWAAIWRSFGNNNRTNLWFDITAYITITTFPQRQVYEFYDDVKITMDLPMEQWPAKDQEVLLSYTHVLSDTFKRIDGKVSDTDEEFGTATFGLRYFSFYALNYGSKGGSGGSGGAGAVKTSDSLSITIPAIGWIASSATLFVAAGAKYRKRRKTAESVEE